MSTDTEEMYIGVGHSLLRLAQGLIKMKALPPDDNPSPDEALGELRDELEVFDSVEDLGLVTLKTLRLAAVMGVRPTKDVIAEGTVVADVQGGLDLLTSIKNTKVDETVRSVGIAISCLIDYAYVAAEPFMDGVSDQEKNELVRSALLIAESSARAMVPEDRMVSGSFVFGAMKEFIDRETKEEEPG